MIFNPFNFIKQNLNPSYLGVDIGTSSIKIVEVGQGENNPKLLNYALLENKGSLLRSNAVFQSSELKIFDKEMIEILRQMIEKMKPTTNQAIASIPVFSSFITILNFPEMSDRELKQAIVFQAKQYVPMPLSEVALDWQKIAEYEDDQGLKTETILLIAIPQDLIKKYQKIFNEVGLSLLALEIEPLSLTRSIIWKDKTPTILVDIGNLTTSISFVEDGILKFVGQTDFAGSSLTKSISTTLNINPLRAEEIKCQRGVLVGGADFELARSMFFILDLIINEIKKLEFNFASNLKKNIKFERLILSGGGANLLGIENYFSHQLNIPVIKAEPLNYIEYNLEIKPLIKELNPLLSVALGLAIRELV
ncbi:MAG: type IV pilus assembly protein PilM [Patescibacteria group bacterium]|nr:type IV pilus assembly protein PilM [Patescibacteria group bacterium]MDW8279759.1 type IV pilus assembly protein PilM [bacterium]